MAAEQPAMTPARRLMPVTLPEDNSDLGVEMEPKMASLARSNPKNLVMLYGICLKRIGVK